MIHVEHLTKVYKNQNYFNRRLSKEKIAVQDVSFQIEKGQIFGLLGINGAGKTTLVKMLSTLLLPTSGNASVGGYDVVKNPNRVRSIINMVSGGDRMLYWRLTGRENLNYFADLYQIDTALKKKRVMELLELVGLRESADERVERYSKGMKQRLQIARGLINDPQVLFMDEATLGLDAPIARDIRRIITHNLRKTILFTSHYIAEVDEICNVLAIIHNGQIVSQGTSAELKKRHKKGNTLLIRVDAPSSTIAGSIMALQDRLKVQIGTLSTPDGCEIRIPVDAMQHSEGLDLATAIVNSAGCQLMELRFEEPSLEDVLVGSIDGVSRL